MNRGDPVQNILRTYVSNLAIRVLAACELRTFVLAPDQAAVLLRGTETPALALPEQTGAVALANAIYAAALARVVREQTGTMTLEAAILAATQDTALAEAGSLMARVYHEIRAEQAVQAHSPAESAA